MAEGYDHKKIEKKWQECWAESQAFAAADASGKPKQYLLIEFPYPSGDGLHVGHIRSWTALDIVARKRRAQGQNVLYPIGWDAFGLPAENYALKTGIHPAIVTKQNTDNFRRQIKALGISFDWSREINTTDPSYYKWTQWIFLQLYKKGLAYKAKTLINWCPKDKIGLANEEVVDGTCERCGTKVEKREKDQWMLAITKYAKRLYDDLETVDYIEAAKAGQRNWIGPSEGAEIEFAIAGSDKTIKVFTTRPDTLFGATYMVLAPEHPLVQELKGSVANWSEVDAYVFAAKAKSDIERSAEGKEKTGVELVGVKAINPANKEEIAVYIADYVLGGYGTGAIMAVPAHDERDYEFAKKFNIPVRQVIEPVLVQTGDSSAFRPDEPMQDSHAIIALVKHWSEDKYLGLTWSNAPGWGTLLTGGIDEGMSAEDTALKELREETGYKNAVIAKRLGVIHGKYYHVPKKLNRFGHAPAFVIELQDDDQDDISAEEAAKHQLHWFTPAELKNFLTAFSHQTTLALHMQGVYTGPGILTNSGEFNGLESGEAKQKITEAVGGSMVTTFKLRDWVFSRQRYWGEPIPMINCAQCGWQPVPEESLPVVLPNVEKYQPADTGESPLSNITEWVNTTCPKCGGPAKRETDVMPNWAGSSWYYLRYTDPHNDAVFAAPNKLNYWTPVDWYNGGMEHTTLHLLYSRFWHKFLFDLGVVPTSEPYLKRTSHGLILAEGGEKMSKSKGNTVSPDELVEQFGADTLRLYEMFIGPFDQPVAWSTKSMVGSQRFLERVWRLQPTEAPLSDTLETLLNQTIKKVGEDIESLKLNTAVSALMILLNEMEKSAPKAAYKPFLQLLAPLAPHLCSELAEQHGISLTEWPTADESKLVAQSATIAVQVNGRVRGTIMVDISASESEVLAAARAAVAKWLEGKVEQKALYIKGKIVTLVVA